MLKPVQKWVDRTLQSEYRYVKGRMEFPKIGSSVEEKFITRTEVEPKEVNKV